MLKDLPVLFLINKSDQPEFQEHDKVIEQLDLQNSLIANCKAPIEFRIVSGHTLSGVQEAM